MDLFGSLPPPASNLAPALSLFGGLPDEKEAAECGLLGKRAERDSDDRTRSVSLKKIKQTFKYSLKGYHGERRGEREDMQDAHVIIDDFTSQFKQLPDSISRVAYYGVYDGHAGHRASEFATLKLHENIRDRMPQGELQNIDREMKKCLIEAFKKTDEEFLQKASEVKPTWKDGSTVAAILVLDDVVYSANLGDSKAILCRRSSSDKQQLTFVQLTKDHNPSNFEERKRIEKAGGTVREGRVLGIVEVSRSIGDGRFKHCGIIATPDVFRTKLTFNDLFILVACDGLWKVFNAEDATRFILNVLEDNTITFLKDDAVATNFVSKKPSCLKDVRYEEACNRLAVEAVKRGCTDNVTVMIVDIAQRDFVDDIASGQKEMLKGVDHQCETSLDD